MIVPFDGLQKLQREVVMVDGGFDPLHQGHIAYFEAASKLGLPVLCSISPDKYVSQKHPLFLAIEKRASIINELRCIEYVHMSSSDTATVLRALRPAKYVKGKDWEGRLPDKELEICYELGIEIVYLDTVFDSSSGILREYFGGRQIASQVDEFEDFILTQSNVGAEHYDAEYFVSPWRTEDNNYTVETRRKIEGKNPLLIRDVFRAKTVVDMGCGPGALLYLLHELGVRADGVDFSADCKEMAPTEVRDRIVVGSVTDVPLADNSYELVICREVFEHLTVLQVQKAVENICRISSRYIYVTTRFHPHPASLFDVTTEFDVDPSHITLMNMSMLRLMFNLQGFRRCRELEREIDWMNKGRVLVYEKSN